jgi:Mo-dependent nitrogenase C-terminus
MMLNSTSPNFFASLLQPIAQKLDAIEIQNAEAAHFFCRLIPSQCPFERDLRCFGWTVHIPPMCKLNPFYEQLVTLRFKALCYLADVCGEDIAAYC